MATYDLLDSTTLGSTVSSVTISGLSSSYRDLIIVFTGKSVSSSEDNLKLRFNGDTGNNYNGVTAEGDKNQILTSASYSNYDNLYESLNDGNLSNSGLNQTIFQVFDYAQTNKHKPVLIKTGNAQYLGIAMGAGRWASTSAITSFTLFAYGSLASGSTIHTYGVVA